MLEARIRHRRGSFALDVSLAVPARGVTAVVGESGAGKSTLLRAVAGLIVPDEGRVIVGGRVVCDRAAGAWVNAEDRPVGYVAQDYALFPHLSARDNVAFGLRAAGVPRGGIRARADAALARFGVGDLAGRRPADLSGGQQQRVALARALVLDPEVLLLDEPMSALDPVSRAGVRAELRRVLAALPCATLFVTHQPAEALTFGDRIVVLEAGKVTQDGTRADLMRRPASRYAAEFVGVNLFEGEIVGRHADGLAVVAVDGGGITVPDPGHAGMVQLLVHPHDITVSRDAPAGSAVNVLRGAIDDLIPELPAGDRVRVVIASRPALAAQITRHSVESLGLARGVEVFASFKASGVTVFPV